MLEDEDVRPLRTTAPLFTSIKRNGMLTETEIELNFRIQLEQLFLLKNVPVEAVEDEQLKASKLQFQNDVDALICTTYIPALTVDSLPNKEPLGGRY
ncbi:unnamed protein product [Calypogeia fissa]